jgi:hypothetical protein
MPKTTGCEFPRLFAEVFSNGTEHTTFDEHPSVEFVIAVQPSHAFDGQPKKNDAVLGGNNLPARDFSARGAAFRHESNFEACCGQFLWPHIFQELGSRGDREFEVSMAATQEGQVRSSHGSADSAAVAITPVSAYRARWRPLR